MAGELRACAAAEAEIQAALRAAGETVTEAEVAAQRLRDQAERGRARVAHRRRAAGHHALRPEQASTGPEQEDDGEQATTDDQPTTDEFVTEASVEVRGEALGEDEVHALRTRVERLTRRREQLGPVNPLAKEEYAEALAHVEELESQRTDLETALRELRSVIRETDRQIEETFEETFAAAARNFEELVGDVFPGGSGRLRLVRRRAGTAGRCSAASRCPRARAPTATRSRRLPRPRARRS